MADDDAPLSVLATATPRKLDDDTPLSSLVGGKPKNTSPAAKKGAAPPAPKGRPPSAKGKAKAAVLGAKRKQNSSSSTTTESDSSSSEGAAKKQKGTKAQKMKLLKKGQTDDFAEDGGPIKKKDRSVKEEVVAQLLCRWWYSDAYKGKDWPPQDEAFYQAKLEESKLRKVTIQEWEWMPEVDEMGRHKVYEMSQFRGLFRNSAGDLIDLRPKETCPCLNNFMKKDMALLCSMLISAYENQLKDLANSKYPTEKTANDIQTALTKIRLLGHQANQVRKP